jgi:hypothetical protein
MLAAYRSLLALHVVLGAIALVGFWVALAARKGGRLHLRSGRIYVLSMSGSAALAVVLGVLCVVDPHATHPADPGWSAAELARHEEIVRSFIPSVGFAGLLALALLHFGWRAPARARRRSRSARALDPAVPGALLALGLAGIALGRLPRFDFADGIGVACVAVALPLLRALSRAGRGRPWIVAHLAGLGGAAVIGHVAFFVSVLPRVAPQIWSRDPAENPIPWLVSPLFGSLLLVWGCRHWRRRLAGGAGPAPAAGR